MLGLVAVVLKEDRFGRGTVLFVRCFGVLEVRDQTEDIGQDFSLLLVGECHELIKYLFAGCCHADFKMSRPITGIPSALTYRANPLRKRVGNVTRILHLVGACEVGLSAKLGRG
jgi:hypothetical protein